VGFDLLRLPVVGRFLAWRHARLSAQLALGFVALVVVLHGFLGPQLAPKNLATVGTWVHYRGLLVAVLVGAGNLFCAACPLLLARDLARRFAPAKRLWPHALRNKWPAVALFVLVLFAYEAFDLWAEPAATAALIVGYFVAAFLVDSVFQRAPFCKYVCPIGQFNFVASTVSPLEVRVRDAAVCSSCKTVDCIRGRRAEDDRDRIVQRGCELDLFLPQKVGNLDCTFCLDCVHACPHDNVALGLRLPGEELALDPVRSSLGRISGRKDLSVLVLVFAFGALLNAFGMVSPVYAFQRWLAGILGTENETVVLGALFALGLVIEPVVLLGAAGFLALRLSGSKEKLLRHIGRFAFAFAPLGVGVWAAHYSFHLLTGLWTIVPVAQAAALDVGLSLGEPQWGRGGFTTAAVQPIELGLLLLGLAGSLGVAAQLARRDFGARWRPALAPWAALVVLLFAAAVWLLQQPMEMRGTYLG
jgi:polyferredoxin